MFDPGYCPYREFPYHELRTRIQSIQSTPPTGNGYSSGFDAATNALWLRFSDVGTFPSATEVTDHLNAMLMQAAYLEIEQARGFVDALYIFAQSCGIKKSKP